MKLGPGQIAVMAGALVGCQSLPDVNPNVCGNLALEPGEDCDGFGDGEGTVCGAPNSLNACFFICDREDLAASPCPDGYGCGDDGRCRRPSESFALSDQLDFPVSEFKVADIDGDGTGDLVGTSQNAFHIAFADGDGSLTPKRFASPAFGGFFSVGDINADGRTDIVTSDGLGVAAFLGRSGQTIEPVPFALFETTEDVEIKSVGLEGSFGVGPDDDQRFLTFIDDPASARFIDEDGTVRGDIDALFGTGFDVGAIETPLSGGDIDGDGNQELALTHLGADRVWVVSFDETIDQSQVGVLQDLVLPDGYVANSRAFFADIDGDLDLDIVVGMVKPGFVALGQAVNSGGTFGAVTKASFFGSTDIEAPIKLLAVAPIDGDDRADYVLSNGIFLANLINAPDLTGTLAQGSFVGAAVVDLNKDGRSDVVTIPDAVPGVEVYVQADTDPVRLNRFALGTSSHFAGNREIIAGDFDGDLISDVALTARSQATGATLEVLFGSLDADFTGPVKMGRFDDIIQLQSAAVLNSINLRDAIDDLLVIGIDSAGGERRKIASFFRGDSSRAMAAPLLLREEVGLEEVFYLPVQTAIGQIEGVPAIFATSLSAGDGQGDGGTRDCSLKDEGCGFGWVLPVVDGRVAVPEAPEMFLEIEQETLFCYEWSASDLLPSQTATDELLGVLSDERCATAGPSSDAVVLFDIENGERTVVAIPPEIAGFGKFITGDLDADGLSDFVSVFGGFDSASDSTPAGVAVFWNEDGQFRVEQVETEGVVTLAVASGRLNADAFDDLVMLGFNTADTSGPSDPQVFAALYDEGVYTAPQPFGAFGFGTAIGVADLDRDGLGDVIVGDGAIARVFLAVPAEPRGTQAAETEDP